MKSEELLRAIKKTIHRQCVIRQIRLISSFCLSVENQYDLLQSFLKKLAKIFAYYQKAYYLCSTNKLIIHNKTYFSMKNIFLSSKQLFEEIGKVVKLYKNIWRERTICLLHARRETPKTDRALDIAL